MGKKTNSRQNSSSDGARRLAGAGVALGRVVVRHPWLAAAAPVVGVAWWRWGPAGLLAVVGVVAVVLVGWWWHHRESFARLVGVRARSAWRREWVYGRRWRRAMFLTGLAACFDGEEIVPRLGRVRSGWSSDTVAVREATGQEPLDWERQAPALAESFGALSCRVRRRKPGRVELEFTTRRRQRLVDPLPVPEVEELDLEAGVPIGRRGDGSVWRLPLADHNVLVAGRPGSGKTEGVLWSLLRGLAGGIAAGFVAVWAGDPKSGTGLAHGDTNGGEPLCPLFARFERGEARTCRMIFEAVEEMYRREADMLAAGQRHHQPSPDSPTLVLVIDELLSITTLLPDRQLAADACDALRLLLSRARATGIIVVAAVQDPRDKAVPFADFFQIKICMGVSRAALVDVVLGTGAHTAGAHAEQIPTGPAGAGQAYVVADDDGGTPIWARASLVTRDVADTMAGVYPSPWAWTDDTGMHRPGTDTEAEGSDVAPVAAPAVWAVSSDGEALKEAV